MNFFELLHLDLDSIDQVGSSRYTKIKKLSCCDQ